MHHFVKKNYIDPIAIFSEKRVSYAPLTPSPTTIIYINIYLKEIVIGVAQK